MPAKDVSPTINVKLVFAVVGPRNVSMVKRSAMDLLPIASLVVKITWTRKIVHVKTKIFLRSGQDLRVQVDYSVPISICYIN